MRSSLAVALCICFVVPDALSAAPTPSDLADSLSEIQKLGKHGAGHAAAIQAWQLVSQADAKQLPQVLGSMRDDNPLANNWVRAAVEVIVQRTSAAGDPVPVDQLEAYLTDRSHSPRSRRLAFELLEDVDAAVADPWIPKFLDDPSLELRRLAVGQVLKQAKESQSTQQASVAVEQYVKALNYARDVDQIEQAHDALIELGETVDLPTHFGFITQWRMIGPFDNTNTGGYDRVFPPEQSIDLDAEYPGKDQLVRWQAAATSDPYGKVDLNELLGKFKGAACYLVAYFDSPMEREVDLRLGCINANKVWLNGEPVMANHVYHAGRGIDQYLGKGTLKKGQNVILLKICQNEQEESWAQDWEFQLRVCDQLGTAVLSRR